MATWTDFFWPLIVLPASNPTVQIALQQLQSGYYVDYSLVLAGATLASLPLLALFAASNEVPTDDSLAALLDRFLLRVRSHNLDSFHFHRLLALGLAHERRGLLGEPTGAAPAGPLPTMRTST